MICAIQIGTKMKYLIILLLALKLYGETSLLPPTKIEREKEVREQRDKYEKWKKEQKEKLDTFNNEIKSKKTITGYQNEIVIKTYNECLVKNNLNLATMTNGYFQVVHKGCYDYAQRTHYEIKENREDLQRALKRRETKAYKSPKSNSKIRVIYFDKNHITVKNQDAKNILIVTDDKKDIKINQKTNQVRIDDIGKKKQYEVKHID
ncbi:MAG: hypothetical protein KU28_08990 [Sulfurovum sp. PC08-66]|nr:MAG: hypothetical protein KU28_08990 [Sulfurovum sp. PC08-66]